MRKSRTAAVAAIAALAVAAAVWVPGPLGQTPASAADKGENLTLQIQFAGFYLIDFGPDSVHQVTDLHLAEPTRGDQTMFRDAMLRNGHVIGYDGGLCTVTDVVPTDPDPIKLACNVTFELPGGQIATQGLATNNPVKPLAIVGGTGRYTGARGEAILTENGDVANTGSVVFHFGR